MNGTRLALIAIVAIFFIRAPIGQANYDPNSDSLVEFFWDIPTQRTNGNTLLPSEIYGYRIYENELLVIEVVGGDIETAIYDFNGYGEGCWSISTVDSYMQEGPQSEQVCDTVKPAGPAAPSLRVSFKR